MSAASKALLAAAQAGDLAELHRLLAGKGLFAWRKTAAHVDYREDGTRRTALHLAARHGHGDCAQLLLEFGSSVHDEDARGRTPLMLAAKAGHTALCCTLYAARVPDGGFATRSPRTRGVSGGSGSTPAPR